MHSEAQHGITRQGYLQLNTTDNDKTTRILTKLQHKYTYLPERPYTALYSWWCVELSPETCRVKPLRRIKAIVASCWNYFTILINFSWSHFIVCPTVCVSGVNGNLVALTYYFTIISFQISQGCTIPGTQSPWRVNFLQRCLIFEGPQYETFFKSPF